MRSWNVPVSPDRQGGRSVDGPSAVRRRSRMNPAGGPTGAGGVETADPAAIQAAARGTHGMCNLSPEWVLESRRQDRETQARNPVDPAEGRVARRSTGAQPETRRRAAMFVTFPVDLLGSLLAVLLIVMIGRRS